MAENLRKRYSQTWALDGFDLTVPAGTVHGLLGPNDAGKTTAVRVAAHADRGVLSAVRASLPPLEPPILFSREPLTAKAA